VEDVIGRYRRRGAEVLFERAWFVVEESSRLPEVDFVDAVEVVGVFAVALAAASMAERAFVKMPEKSP
jgi:hypothetical protein